MKRILIVAVCTLLALTACAPSDSLSQVPASDESSRVEMTLSMYVPDSDEIPINDCVNTITPNNGERIQKKKAEIEDVVGWLTVPGTDIDSMIVHNPEKDNSFYTNHDFDGNPSKDGAYFADNRCDFTTPTQEGISQNIALFGHNWDEDPNGRLFAQLKRFKEPNFAKTHPYIFFSTEVEDMVWEVFAVYDISVNQPYIIPDLPWASLKEMLDIAYDASVLDYGIHLNESDKILTLSTCSFEVPGKDPLPLDRIPDYRFVVMARLVSQDDALKETVAVTINDSLLQPDDMPVIYSHYADVVQYDGTLYENLAKRHANKVPVIDSTSLVPVGEVARSSVMRDLQDLDATSLPEGTPLYRLEGHENLLVARPGEETFVYGYEMESE